MRILLHMASSLNGMIARPNDDTDFLSHDHWAISVELARQAGALVWGRRTHEEIRRYGEQFLRDLQGLTGIVLSSNQQLALEPGWSVAGTPQQALELAAAAGHQQLLLVGGAAVNTLFAQAGLIDEVLLSLESVFVGSGIPIFAPAQFDLRLHLLEVRRPHPEIIQLHYQVLK